MAGSLYKAPSSISNLRHTTRLSNNDTKILTLGRRDGTANARDARLQDTRPSTARTAPRRRQTPQPLQTVHIAILTYYHRSGQALSLENCRCDVFPTDMRHFPHALASEIGEIASVERDLAGAASHSMNSPSTSNFIALIRLDLDSTHLLQTLSDLAPPDHAACSRTCPSGVSSVGTATCFGDGPRVMDLRGPPKAVVRPAWLGPFEHC